MTTAIIERLRGFVTADGGGASVTEDEMQALLDCAEALERIAFGKGDGLMGFKPAAECRRIAETALAALERAGK